MICNKCGNKNRSYSKFCDQCGAHLSKLTNNTKSTPNNLGIRNKDKIEKQNKTNKVFFIAGLVLQLITTVLIIVSFIIKNPLDMILCLAALGLEMVYIILCIVKTSKNKKIKNS